MKIKDLFCRKRWATYEDIMLLKDVIRGHAEAISLQIQEQGRKTMITLDTLSTDTADALAASTAYIQDVNSEFTTLTKQIADLKTALASLQLPPDAQQKLDAADGTVVSMSTSLKAADAAIKASQSDDGSTAGGSTDSGSAPTA